MTFCLRKRMGFGSPMHKCFSCFVIFLRNALALLVKAGLCLREVFGFILVPFVQLWGDIPFCSAIGWYPSTAYRRKHFGVCACGPPPFVTSTPSSLHKVARTRCVTARNLGTLHPTPSARTCDWPFRQGAQIREAFSCSIVRLLVYFLLIFIELSGVHISFKFVMR